MQNSTIRTRNGLAHQSDLQKSLGDDWFRFTARFRRCTEHAEPDWPEYSVPCRFVYEWYGAKDCVVNYISSEKCIEIVPVKPEEIGSLQAIHDW